MKRYRVARFQFDTRAQLLDPVPEHWEASVRESHLTNQRAVLNGLQAEFGSEDGERKVADFKELGPLPLSIVAFHNVLFQQTRRAFVQGAYYPALTGICALGERILNQLVLTLRDLHSGAPGFEKVERMVSSSNWKALISTLEGWSVLAPGIAQAFRDLANLRHRSLHFTPDDPVHAREPALAAHQLMAAIVDGQFGVLGKRPWSLWVPGEIYVRKAAEEDSFVKRIYLPNCILVGPWHKFEDITLRLVEYPRYDDREIPDDEFCRLREEFNASGQRWPE